METTIDRNVGNNQKLYRCSYKLDNFKRHDGVRVYGYIKSSQTQGRDYTLFVRNYKDLDEQGKFYAEAVVDELFTGEQAVAFSAYMKRVHNITVTISPVTIPLESNMLPYDALGSSINGTEEFLEIYKEEGYDLEFAVGGVLDLTMSKTAEDRRNRHNMYRWAEDKNDKALFTSLEERIRNAGWQPSCEGDNSSVDVVSVDQSAPAIPETPSITNQDVTAETSPQKVQIDEKALLKKIELQELVESLIKRRDIQKGVRSIFQAAECLYRIYYP